MTTWPLLREMEPPPIAIRLGPQSMRDVSSNDSMTNCWQSLGMPSPPLPALPSLPLPALPSLGDSPGGSGLDRHPQVSATHHQRIRSIVPCSSLRAHVEVVEPDGISPGNGRADHA